MGQRISIQFTVDVDELPREVGRLLESAFNEYQILQPECRRDLDISVLSYEMVEKIDRVRLVLGTMDHRLNDASNIISGYLAFKAQEGPASLAAAPASVDELQEKLSQFKESLAPPQSNETSD